MAILRTSFFSEALGLSTAMTVLLPETTTRQIGMTGTRRDATPVLYLLHGLSDDDSIWTRRTSIERYAAPLGLAVVMPQAARSFYADEVEGLAYWTFLTEELPALVQQFFRVSDRREDTFVAGLSMGGYGAMKWALHAPERFAAAASLSGVLDLAALVREPTDERDRDFARVFGIEPIDKTGDDVMHLLEHMPADGSPALYVACGKDDWLYPQNVDFAERARERGLTLTTDFGTGDHEWDYWDAQIAEVLNWLPIRD